MAVKVLILEDNPVARSFLCRVVRESFSDTMSVTEAGDLDSARKQISIAGGASGMHGVDPFKLIMVDLDLPDGTGSVTAAPNQFQAGSYRRERISQFVRQHRKEFVLARVGVAQLLFGAGALARLPRPLAGFPDQFNVLWSPGPR